MMKKISKYVNTILAVFAVVVVAVLYLLYQNYDLKKQNEATREELSKKMLELSSATSTIFSLKNNFQELAKEKNKLEGDLNNEILKMTSLQEQVQGITGTVGILEKLSKTDKELLQKYSKVCFMSENYIPNKLTQIDTKYTYNKNMDKWMHGNVWPYLQRLLSGAVSDGVDLLVSSAYRSFETQTQLKNNYSMSYGSGANKFSADQGYSEHQLGTTIDFTTSSTGDNFSFFKNTDAYIWLTDNAYKYGFVLSYPETNGYYIFESWHWRFVGVALADRLNSDGIYFYDLSQREIDEYLVNIFD
jgi:LAS superfamily LD-carboxypeptidase LdcB